MADSTNGSSSQKPFRVIGTRPIRHDGIEKVTGRAKYGADYSFPGMLYGKVLRSPHAHARIIAIRRPVSARDIGSFHGQAHVKPAVMDDVNSLGRLAWTGKMQRGRGRRAAEKQ